MMELQTTEFFPAWSVSSIPELVPCSVGSNIHTVLSRCSFSWYNWSSLDQFANVAHYLEDISIKPIISGISILPYLARQERKILQLA
jgi:hypothetical protein